jgi:hypothetical protein
VADKPEDRKRMIRRMARYLGCTGTHEGPNGQLMPCSSAEELNRISDRAEPKKKMHIVEMEKPKKRRRVGKKPRRWEPLGERGVLSIETLPGGGLVSGKSFLYGRAKPRLGDPDVFTTPDAARLRARTLGCIGIARRQTPDGDVVWTPCTNVSDYRRRMGVGPQAARDRARREREMERRLARRLDRRMRRRGREEVKALPKANPNRESATPALPEERISGSSRNPKGSAASRSSGRGIELSAATVETLKKKVKEHNEKMREQNKPDHAMASLGALKSVWRRGAGAFSVSHRPGKTRSQWAFARVNAFLRILATGKPSNPRYVTDNDLLPKNHPRRSGSKSLPAPVTPRIF